MSVVSEDYLRIAEENFDGVNEAALESLVYWNNPLALDHWTMNVVEVLLIVGAVMAFLHARQVWRQTADPTNLCLFWGSIVYLFVSEVPLYFPHLLGLDIGFVFAHNEFSAGILYNQTPLYIMALYPALLYPSYVLVQATGLFNRRFGLWAGAICVGAVHSSFYEIFDHFGPQYTWWVWNFENPMVRLRFASVPWTSVIVFSLTPPMVATVLVRLLLRKRMPGKAGGKAALSTGGLAAFALVLGVLLPVINGVLPSSAVTSAVTDDALAISLWASLLGLSIVFAVLVFARSPAGGEKGEPAAQLQGFWGAYPFNFFTVYLLVFLGLWAYALPAYLAAENGVTASNTPIGSLPYVVLCFALCAFFLLRASRRRDELRGIP